MKKKKNIIITAVIIVLVAIIAIVLVKINSSNVSNKENKNFKAVRMPQKIVHHLLLEQRILLYLVLTAVLISLIKEQDQIQL